MYVYVLYIYIYIYVCREREIHNTCIYIYIYIYVYIYIYIERERDIDRLLVARRKASKPEGFWGRVFERSVGGHTCARLETPGSAGAGFAARRTGPDRDDTVLCAAGGPANRRVARAAAAWRGRRGRTGGRRLPRRSRDGGRPRVAKPSEAPPTTTPSSGLSVLVTDAAMSASLAQATGDDINTEARSISPKTSRPCSESYARGSYD